MLKFTYLGKKISSKDIQSIESYVGLTFPDQYKQHLLKYNGGEPSLDTFIFKENGEIQSSDLRFLLGLGGKYNDLKDYIKAYKIDEKRMPINILPIGYDSGGNAICISCSGKDKGYIYFWDHEREVDYDYADDSDYSNLYIIAKSFNEFLDGLMSFEDYERLFNESKKSHVSKKWYQFWK